MIRPTDRRDLYIPTVNMSQYISEVRHLHEKNDFIDIKDVGVDTLSTFLATQYGT